MRSSVLSSKEGLRFSDIPRVNSLRVSTPAQFSSNIPQKGLNTSPVLSSKPNIDDEPIEEPNQPIQQVIRVSPSNTLSPNAQTLHPNSYYRQASHESAIDYSERSFLQPILPRNFPQVQTYSQRDSYFPILPSKIRAEMFQKNGINVQSKLPPDREERSEGLDDSETSSTNVTMLRSLIRRRRSSFQHQTEGTIKRSYTTGSRYIQHTQTKQFEEDELQRKEKGQEAIFYAKVEADSDLRHHHKFLHNIRTDLNPEDAEAIFIDETFAPSFRSLVGTNHEKKDEWNDCIWLNPGQIFSGKEVDIFGPKIDPETLKQGRLADCYFLASISSLAQWPDRIKKIFVNKHRNSLGCYSLRVCEMGEWREVAVDGFLPCYKDTMQPMFTTGGDDELWVMILEKAWAKIYGSYATIERGLTREALHDLTGAPTRFMLTDDVDDFSMIWNKLKKAVAKNYVVTCGTMGSFETSLSLKQSVGLIRAHSYSLLGVYLEKTEKGTVKLVKLRNPWGNTEWKGPWKDSCANWTSQIKNRLGWKNEDDGTFFMEYEEFMRYFEDIQFCYVHDDYKYNYLRVRSSKKHASYFKMSINTPGKYYITVNQESKRRDKMNPVFKYSTVTIIISRVLDNQQYEYISGNWLADREVWAKANLTPGDYIVYVKIQWTQRSIGDFVISSYGPNKVTFEGLSKDKYKDFLTKTFTSHALTSENVYRYVSCNEPDSLRVIDLPNNGFLYSYYQNGSNKKMNCYATVPEGFKIMKPYRGKDFTLSIPPGKDRMVLFRSLPDQEMNGQWDEKIEFKSVKTGDVLLTLVELMESEESEPALTVDAAMKNAKREYLDEDAKDNGEMRRLKNKFTGKYVNIFRYELRTETGYFLLIENETEDLAVKMRVKWELKGVKPVGAAYLKEIWFELGPKGVERLVFQRTDEEFSAEFKYEYEIARLRA